MEGGSLLQPDYLPGQEQGCAMPPTDHPVAHQVLIQIQPNKCEFQVVLKEASTALPKLKMLVVDCKQGAVRNVRLSVDGMYMITCGQVTIIIIMLVLKLVLINKQRRLRLKLLLILMLMLRLQLLTTPAGQEPEAMEP